MKCPHKTRHQLVHLQDANVLSQTDVLPCPKLKQRPRHLLDLICARFQPSLRAVGMRIMAVNASIALHNPWVDTDNSTPRHESAADHRAGRGDDALVVETESGMHTEGFLDAGVQVGEGARFGIASIAENFGRGYAWERSV
jgi:hypothetical protein